MVAGPASGRSAVIVVVDIAGTCEVAVGSETVGGASETRTAVGDPASGAAVVASFAFVECGIEGHGGGAGAEVAGVDDLQSGGHAGGAAGVVDAGEAGGVAGGAGAHAILEISCLAGTASRIVRDSVHRRIASQAVCACPRTRQAPAVAFGAQLHCSGGLEVAGHAQAKLRDRVVGSKGGGVAGEANGGGEAGEASGVAGGAGGNACVEISVHAYAKRADTGQ